MSQTPEEIFAEQASSLGADYDAAIKAHVAKDDLARDIVRTAVDAVLDGDGDRVIRIVRGMPAEQAQDILLTLIIDTATLVGRGFTTVGPA